MYKYIYQESFITKRKLRIFTVFISVFFTLSTFANPFLQLGSVVQAQETPDSFPLEIPEPEIEPTLSLDVTSPTGSIEIDNESEETTDTDIEVTISAQDPAITDEANSGIGSYIISQSSAFSDATWITFDGTETVLNFVIPNAPNTYTYYIKYKDNANNESEVYSDSITFASTAPIGSIEIDIDEQVDVDGQLQVQDNDLKLYLNATNNVHITEYILSNDNDFSDDSWTTIETPANTFDAIVEQTIEDTTGTYEYYIKYKNIFGEESDVYSASAYYQSYDITPSLELESQDVLLGDEMNLSATLNNAGEDIGYNARFEITLPKGFEYLYPMEYKEFDEELSEGGIEPTFVATNEEGLQVLVYEGIDDLLTRESTAIHARISVGGVAEGYKLGDLVDIPISGQLFKRSSFSTGYEITENLQVELTPFTVDFEGGANNQGEQLVEEETENKLTIETNPDIASDPAVGEETTDGDLAEENPLVVQFELDNGTSYLEGSEQIMVNGVLVGPEEYDITFQYFEDLVSKSPVLRWIFNDVVGVDTLVEIYFDSKINKIEDETILGMDFVEHEQNIEERLQVDGNYSNEGEGTVTYSEEEINNITAKYFIVDKYATSWRTDINETVQYTIKIETSQDYDLSGIEIIDELPDGVTFTETNANISSSEDLLLNLFDYLNDTETGKEILTWRINAGDGIPAGTTYEFSYEVMVDSNYEVKELEDNDDRIFSRDNLVSKITINGLWTDVEDGIFYDREETIDERNIEDTNRTGNRLHEVTFSEGIKHAYETVYSEELDAKIGDVLDVYGELTFPDNTPTNNANYRVYLPIGTELNGNFNITSDLGTAVTPKKIEGGYLFELGKVEPGKSFKVEYQLNVLNDANLKEAVKTRNLFRGDYTNIDNGKFTYRENVTLNLIEPQIDVSKKVTNGYLARGEEAVIQVRVVNNGTDDAFGISITDSVPTGTTIVTTTDSITSGTATYTITDGVITFDELSLAPGEEIVLEYTVLTASETNFGDGIDSEITVSDFSNRADIDPLPARLYEAETYEYNWNAKEALLITSAPEIEVGRDQSYQYTFTIDPVGGAPIYDMSAVIDLSSLNEIVDELDNVSYTVFINGNEETVLASDITTGLYTFESIDLLPNQELSIVFELDTPTYTVFDQSFNTSIAAVGFDALEDTIRVDGSAETDKDSDIDDMDTGMITIVKSDFEAPVGSVTFRIDGSEVTTTNQDSVDELFYQAQDNTGIAGVQFSNDMEQWETTDKLELLSNEITELLGLEDSWNTWGGDSLLTTQNSELSAEGRNYRYMRVVDVEGNISIIENSIIKDTLPPIYANVVISPFENDFTDPSITGVFNNYISIEAYDSTNETNDISDIGSYRFCVPINEFSCNVDESWSEWNELENNETSFVYEFSAVEEFEQLEVYVEVRDNAGNTYPGTVYDSITYDKDLPLVNIIINDDQPFTNQISVLSELSIIDTTSGVSSVRYSSDSNCIDSSSEATDEEINTCNFGEWTNLDRFNAPAIDFADTEWDASFSQTLFRHWEEGLKTSCVQLRDANGNLSNISCDEISLDMTEPNGFMLINNAEAETDIRDVTLNIAAIDPLLFDGTQGSNNVQARLSTHGTDCKYLQDLNTYNVCEDQWSEWKEVDSAIDWELLEQVGEQTVYMQLIDGAGNISDVVSSSIVYNPFTGSGGIVINNNNAFTNSRYVDLNLNIDVTEYCQGCTDPVLMRFIQSDNVPNIEQDVILSGVEGWSDWHEYPNTDRGLDLFGVNSYPWDIEAGKENRPNYGIKTIYVEYKLPNTDIVGPYFDSIIYAPYYGVTYSSVDISSLGGGNTYSLNNVPSEFVTQDDFTIKFNAENFGSFTWLKESDHPVRITYKWIRTGGELSEGWSEELLPNEIRGNSVILPQDIYWNQETGELTLNIDTPFWPGEYDLVLDTVHEGVTWFGDVGNETPTFPITISENPDKPTPQPDFGEILGDEDLAYGGPIPVSYDWEPGGWGHNCGDTYGNNGGRTCYISGTWRVNSDTGYKPICASTGGYYQYEVSTQLGSFDFCPGNSAYWDQFLNQEMAIKVTYNTGSAQNTFRINDLKPVRKTWHSKIERSYNFDYLYSPILVNRSNADEGIDTTFPITIKSRNIGTQSWYKGQVFLVALDKPLNQGGREVASKFADSSWYSSSRLNLAYNGSGWGQSSNAPFTFNIHVPENTDFGKHQQCFVVTNNPFERWEGRDSFCITIDVQMTFTEKQEYFCSLPHEIYIEQDEDSDVIGFIEENTEFIIIKEDGDWSRVFTPPTTLFEDGYSIENVEKGWIKNDLDCFSESEIVENIIPTPELEIVTEPEGDIGVVINTFGIDVKTGPAELFDTLATLEPGDEVQVIAEAHMPDQYGGWLLVRLNDDKCASDELTDAGFCEGWVPKGTIWHVNDPDDVQVSLVPKLVRGHVCGGNDTPVYPAPGVTSYEIGTLSNYQNIPVIFEWNGWFQVYTDQFGSTGWIQNVTQLCEGYIWRSQNFCGSDIIGYPYESEKKWNPELGGFRSYTRPDHNGIDLLANYGEPVLAAHSGSIIDFSEYGTPGGAAKFVKINSDELQIQTGYWHLSGIADTVRDGWVAKGEVIGFTGNTGFVSPLPAETGNVYSGTHLHFYVWDYSVGDYQDPTKYIGGNSGTCDFAREAIDLVNQLYPDQCKSLFNNPDAYFQCLRTEGPVYESNGLSIYEPQNGDDYREIDIDVRFRITGTQGNPAVIYAGLGTLELVSGVASFLGITVIEKETKVLSNTLEDGIGLFFDGVKVTAEGAQMLFEAGVEKITAITRSSSSSIPQNVDKIVDEFSRLPETEKITFYDEISSRWINSQDGGIYENLYESLLFKTEGDISDILFEAHTGGSGGGFIDIDPEDLPDDLKGPKKTEPDNEDLRKIVDELYRPNARAGNGGTADALRYEKLTGDLLSNTGHGTKTLNKIRELEKWLTNNPFASTKDKTIARNLLEDLYNARNFIPF